MNANTEHTKKTIAEFMQYFLLVAFTLFALYFSVSSFRLYHMRSYDLKTLTEKVESVSYKKPQGKQGKPEVWIDLGLSEKFRLSYGTDEMLHSLSNQIRKGDIVTIYLKNPHHFLIDLGRDNDVLQVAKRGDVIYSLDVPQKSFHDYYLVSAIMSFLLPVGCIFYWIKSKSNSMLETLHPAQFQHPQVRG